MDIRHHVTFTFVYPELVCGRNLSKYPTLIYPQQQQQELYSNFQKSVRIA